MGSNKTAVTGMVICLMVLIFAGIVHGKVKLPTGASYTNSVGMKLSRIEAGGFRMGFEGKALSADLLRMKATFADGDFDEHPAHNVKISGSFYMGVYEVTNSQYERFDPGHVKQRGRRGQSKGDDDAVVFVSWNDAERFCRWLSAREGLPYRLATEAEWEYACRAGTTTAFYAGETLPDGFFKDSRKTLKVGQSQPNAWGLYDMCGNVEEWCYDWYGPYEAQSQVDPVGRSGGNFKVTRGGSHSTLPYFLRSANRLGSLPGDRQWLIGFRVVLGELPMTAAPSPATENHQRYVKQNVPADIAKGPDPDKPYFKGPRLYVKIPAGSKGPLYEGHNHFSSIAECPNGDLLAAWFTCNEERGRELAVAASRLRYGQENWEPASLFWDGPDRNDHSNALWYDGKGKLYHFNGLGVIARNLALLLRTSDDSGATWSPARFVWPDHDVRKNYVVESIFRGSGGEIIVPADGKGGTVLSISRDDGRTWSDPGGSVRGIHAGVVELSDGRLMGFGRKAAIEGKMPMSISRDGGKTFEYSASENQPLNLGQRVAFFRLKEGPLFLASFCKKIMIMNSSGLEHEISGLFAAVSMDEGKTWPHKRLIFDDGPTREVQTMDGHPIEFSPYSSERVGYLSVCQTPDGLVHLLSSRQHYTFNLKWLTTRQAAAPRERAAAPAAWLPRRPSLAKVYEPKGLPSEHEWAWGFRGGGLSESEAINTSRKPARLKTESNQQCWWRTAEADGYGAIEQKKGFSAEIRTQIVKTTAGSRGVDLELYDGAGSRYAVTITDSGIYWYEGLVMGSVFLEFDQFVAVAEGLDNTDKMHTYRLAVRPDRVAQVYRDNKMMGTVRYEYRTPRDAYILFGAGGGVEALVDYVAYDLGGAFQP